MVLSGQKQEGIALRPEFVSALDPVDLVDFLLHGIMGHCRIKDEYVGPEIRLVNSLRLSIDECLTGKYQKYNQYECGNVAILRVVAETESQEAILFFMRILFQNARFYSCLQLAERSGFGQIGRAFCDRDHQRCAQSPFTL